MNELAALLVMLLVAVAIAVTIEATKRNVEFRASLKEGDKVYVYDRSERIQATIVSIEDTHVTVIYEDATMQEVDILLIHKEQN